MPAQKGEAEKYSLAVWYPPVDIREGTEGYHFDLESPGLDRDQIHVNIENNMLIIKGVRKVEVEMKDKNVFRVERSYGSFARSSTLPTTADTTKVDAEYKDGILKIKITKKEEAKPKQIDVNVS